MATKKRQIPAAVTEHLERKRKLSASLAVRQSRGLDKSARERLKALTDSAPPEDDDLNKRLSDSFAKVSQQWIANLNNAWLTPIGSNVFGPIGSITVKWEPGPPAIDATKLEALKNAKARKVAVQVPDMVHVLTGWRGWTLKGGRLAALGTEQLWPTRKALEAECKAAGFGGRAQHLAPEWKCTCGIWSFKDVDRLVEAISSQYPAVKVIGSVSLWGKVIETENGYRAQYAYPSELWLLDDSLEELGRIYDVPVRTVSTQDTATAQRRLLKA